MAKGQRHVIGIDSSTQSTKAIVWNANGTPVAEGRAPIPLAQPRPGHVEQDPEDWWRSVCAALREALAAVDPMTIVGLAVSNQRETVALLDGQGRALMPALTWLDERALPELAVMSDAIGAETLHRISGKPVDVTPAIYRLSWLRRHRPDLLDKADRIVDVQAYLVGRLTGEVATGWSSADPFGVFDIEAKAWSAPLLAHLDIRPEQMATVHKPGGLIGRVTRVAADATGLAPGTAVFAGGGDGQCAGLGVDAMRPGVVYLNLGTAIVAGAWSSDPLLGRHWRTMIAADGEGYFLEAVQRAGTFLIDWYIDTFAGGRSDPAVFDRLEQAAAALPIGAEGVMASTHFTGCMNPHWDPRARAAFVGLGPGHGPAHIYRAVLEGLSLEVARALDAMRNAGVASERILAMGGGARNALWVRMIADSTGLPVQRSLSNEATALGAGILAAVGAGLHPDVKTAARAMTNEAETTVPDPAARAAWDRLSARQARVYAAVQPFGGALLDDAPP